MITNYGDTVVCVPGASKPAQAAESASAMRLRLDADELAALNEAADRATKPPARARPGQRAA
ncbi:hypothetical protein [Microlunatus soli]|uniref:Aldo/keto reductase family protein n=1 Tax=Microlunatus soli TaxID=630515 RepID=A0A1H1RG89_9ACTN|nr:hypothetical protein [Microlunatus soli]SDS34718.1 hypothetical protein SAMN04489812_1638 [Microlunatus soli]